jgi:hypothetical protein
MARARAVVPSHTLDLTSDDMTSGAWFAFREGRSCYRDNLMERRRILLKKDRTPRMIGSESFRGKGWGRGETRGMEA